MSHDRLIVALMFVLVPCLVLRWNDREQTNPAAAAIFSWLRHECDPDNPEANYYWSQSSMPTERKREAIITECRKLGAELLPDVLREMRREKDDEVHGMLVVIAAALGDEGSLEPASREMVWSDFPAVRISAVKALRRLKDKRSIEWFLMALHDEHFVVDGSCGTFREKLYPVRTLAQVALKEVMGERYPGENVVNRMSRGFSERAASEDATEKRRRLEEEAMKAMR